MSDAFIILGARDETDISRYIFAAIFVIIWLISAGLSALNKQKEKARRQRMLQEMERQALRQPQQARDDQRRHGPPPLPDAILRQLPNPLPPQVPQPQQRRPQQKKFKAKKPKPVPVPTYQEEVAESVPQMPRSAPIAPARPVAAANAQGATAESLNRWMRPATLRQQFILTEVFQPPKSLRNE